MNRAVLEALGELGFLINVARGSVVDQGALAELLAGGSVELGWLSPARNSTVRRGPVGRET